MRNSDLDVSSILARFQPLKSFIERNSGSAFKRNFMSVLRANVLGQALAVAILPILTRLYSATDFGALALFSAITALLLAIATLKFDWMIPNARSKVAAAGLLAIGFVALMIFVALVVVVLATGWADLLIGMLESNEQRKVALISLAYLIPVALLGTGLVTLLKGWHIRTNELSYVSRITVMQIVVKGVLSISGGLTGLGAMGLISAFTTSAWVGSVALARSASGLWRSARRISIRRLHCLVSRFGSEAAWSTAVSLVNAASLTLPLMLITSFYSLKEAGWYSLMMTIAAGPVSLVTSALGQSYWAHAASLAKAGSFGELNAHYLRTTRRLAWGCLPIAVGCGLGPLVVGPIFGKEEWGGAGYILLSMLPMLIGSLVFSPTNHLVVLKRQSMQLLADSLRIVMVVMAIVGSSMFGWGIYIAVTLASLASLSGHLMLFSIHLNEHKKHE